MNYCYVESYLHSAWNFVEQDQFELAQSHLDDAIYQLGASYRRFMKRKTGTSTRENWLREVDEGPGGPDDKQLFGVLLPRVIILRALVQCERGDFSRAQRGLSITARCVKRLPLRTRMSRNAAVEHRNSRRTLEAQCRDVDGRIKLDLGEKTAAMLAFEESLRIKEDAGAAYQLASLAVGEAEGPRLRKANLEKARRAIDHLRRIDIRNVYDARVKSLEQRLDRF